MKQQKKQSGKGKKLLFFFFVLWTGILFGLTIKRYAFVNRLEKEMMLLFADSSLESKKEFSLLTAGPGRLKEWKMEKYFEEAEEMIQAKEEKKETKKEPDFDIVLFDNGTSDITSANTRVTEGERDRLETVKDDLEGRLAGNRKIIAKLKKAYSRSYLLKKFYITDSSTSIDNRIFQVKKLLTMKLSLKKEKKPQILILHTHGASEAFIDSKKGKEDSIIGVGSRLAEILSKKYGYQVIHDKTEYDRIGGEIDRNKAYNMSLEGARRILKKYPSIQIVIDLHRDGVGNHVKRTTIVDGKRTAQVMFFNGLSRNSSGNIAYLKNPNLQANLAFSLQLKIACMQHFENFAKPIYLKGYRYNMHLRKRYTLIELGNENNTVTEAKNAAAPLALAIHEVLSKK